MPGAVVVFLGHQPLDDLFEIQVATAWSAWAARGSRGCWASWFRGSARGSTLNSVSGCLLPGERGVSPRSKPQWVQGKDQCVYTPRSPGAVRIVRIGTELIIE